MLSDVLFRIGQAIGGLESRVHAPGARPGPLDGGEPDGEDGDDEGTGGAVVLPDEASIAAGAALSALGAWLASRLLRPKPVSWPRVVVAGVTAALLADLVGRMEDDDAPGGLPYAHDPVELLGRVSAGVAVAAGYASILYPRIPGSPLFRGLAFGALEIAAAPRGGLIRIASETPGLRFPLQALALPVDEDAGPVAHMVFGLALGLLYRDGPLDDDDVAGEDDEADD